MRLVLWRYIVKKVLKIIFTILGAVIVAFALLILILSLTEFKPKDIENSIVISKTESYALDKNNEIKLLSWNIGYAGLGKEADFFMDGGKGVRSAKKSKVAEHLGNISETIDNDKFRSDIYFLQEVDQNSDRSYRINEVERLARQNTYFAKNYSCLFVPFPFPPIGKVNSGLMTSTKFEVSKSERYSLPVPFKWPVRLANLKRCLLVDRIPLKDSDKELVAINLHLEAYDSGEGKIAQRDMLIDILKKEYDKGNYVIAGGDFNQSFPNTKQKYPLVKPDLWDAGELTDDMLPEEFSYAYDDSVPTCRLNNQPYNPDDKENTQHYVIDGFMISPNIEIVEVKTIDMGFEDSDHNPVSLRIKLK